MTAAQVPAVEGWFSATPEPHLTGSRCLGCRAVYFPPTSGICRNHACAREEFAPHALSRTGRVWSYTDAQYEPPAPYISTTEPFEPFGIAAVELPEGIVVLGQLAEGFRPADIHVGAEVETTVEVLYRDEQGDRTIWRWRPTGRGHGDA